ncbi:hypothetical protein [Mucilaginibacter sp. SP1R1]|uniref:hypothetical protein n=1 Tax=Mucilaginibacter sp. SP1R1 TaxID=2723091 RepID=UPI00161C1337|nr:hypothetical protein [Mucilaginibacter sp. SP1R1]MBB6149467.1 hypothetical protein [Mucilaginibacter sp. SP1R1]
MTVQELRIGNYVRASNPAGEDDSEWINIHCKVEAIPSKTHVQVIDGMIWSMEWITGIEISDEWLIKFGFEKWLLDSNENCSYYKLGVLNLMISDSGHSYGCSFEPENNNSWFTEVQYVHQLQNLYFALTGEELEVI